MKKRSGYKRMRVEIRRLIILEQERWLRNASVVLLSEAKS